MPVALATLLTVASIASCSVQGSADDSPDISQTPAIVDDTVDDAGRNAGDDDSPEPHAADPDVDGDSARPGRDVPALDLPLSAPGSDAAYQSMIDDLAAFLDEGQADTVPWPDLRTSDPVEAYRSCAEFQNWMSENNTTPWLVEAYTAPASPERGWDLELFADLDALDLLSTPSSPPYEMRVEGLVHPAATDITDALLAQVPAGSVAVVYWDSVGTSQLVRPDGTVFSTNDGWSDVGPWVAIMAPTDVGWQVWWDELTDVPPPGLDDDRGLPATPVPRRDV